ncbi:unnamed protein product, partial [Ectocarpus sp. 12 AP-2014]
GFDTYAASTRKGCLRYGRWLGSGKEGGIPPAQSIFYCVFRSPFRCFRSCRRRMSMYYFGWLFPAFSCCNPTSHDFSVRCILCRVRQGVEFTLFDLQKKMGVMLVFTAP